MLIKCFNTTCQNILAEQLEDGSIAVKKENHFNTIVKGDFEWLECQKCGTKTLVNTDTNGLNTKQLKESGDTVGDVG